MNRISLSSHTSTHNQHPIDSIVTHQKQQRHKCIQGKWNIFSCKTIEKKIKKKQTRQSSVTHTQHQTVIVLCTTMDRQKGNMKKKIRCAYGGLTGLNLAWEKKKKTLKSRWSCVTTKITPKAFHHLMPCDQWKEEVRRWWRRNKNLKPRAYREWVELQEECIHPFICSTLTSQLTIRTCQCTL